MKIAANMLVKNGVPFVIPVLEQVMPFMNRCLVTYCKYSEDDTRYRLKKLSKKYPNKLVLFEEMVVDKGYLTLERQKLLGRTTEDWVLFLDADDYWSTESLEKMMKLLNGNADAYAFNPYQVIDKERYDGTWWNKYFSKLFRNQLGVHYEGVYPKDNIYKFNENLWWKKNKKVERTDIRYFHLSNIMKWRFRDYDEGRFKAYVGKRTSTYPDEVKKDVDKIFSYI